MIKRITLLLCLLLMGAAIAAGCGGNEPAPTPTPMPLPTFTPTPAATATTAPAPTEAPTAEPTAAQAVTGTAGATETVTGPVTAVVTEPLSATTPTVTDTTTATTGVTETAPAVAQPESPLAQPQSPLPAPAGGDARPGATAPAATAPAATGIATATQAVKPVTGYWQLESILQPNATQPISAPVGYRLELNATGIARASADCKTGVGSYAQGENKTLRLQIALSDQKCMPASLAESFAVALGQVTGYDFVDNKLVLSYGTQGGKMTFAPVPLASSFGASVLTWPILRNSTYMISELPGGDGQARLINGESHVHSAKDPSLDYVVALASQHAYGDLDEDGVADAAIVLVTGYEPITPTGAATATVAAPETATATQTATATAELTATAGTTATAPTTATAGTPAASGKRNFYLLPVLNGSGNPIPLRPQPLGEDLFIRNLAFDGKNVVIDFATRDPATGECCIGAGRRQTYTLDNDRFKQVADAESPAAAPKAVLDLPTQEVTLKPDATGALLTTTLTGAMDFNAVHAYRVPAQAGQQMTVTVQSPYGDVWLSAYGEGDRTVLRSIRTEANDWAGVIPSTQNYIVNAVATGSGGPYTLTVELAAPAQAAAQAAAAPVTPTQSAEKVVHLAFEGSPGAATASVLAALQGAQATADFFVPAGEPAQSLDAQALTAITAAGSGLGVQGPNANFAPTGSDRDRLFATLSATDKQLPPQALGRCLRPPSQATDAYTRANAAELGYKVVQWDLDARTQTADGLKSMLDQVFPGAVIRVAGNDAGVALLQQLLPALAQQGYAVRSLCAPAAAKAQ